MNAGLIQTLWADVIACTLRDAGVPLVVISPGSRSTPLVAALARAKHPNLVTIIDERAAAFYALGAARATGKPTALVCTSGSAAAHYLPALVEAAQAGIPLLAITADRPGELQHCGASQTIDQRAIYGSFVRASFDLGPPSGEVLAYRAVRRTIIQAITASLGPDPGPVHLDVPLRKPLEPVASTTDPERALAADVADVIADKPMIAPPRLAPDARGIEGLARAIAGEPRGLIVAGALSAIARDAIASQIFELARRSGYPIVAEAGSQLRSCARPDDVVFVDAFDVIASAAPRPALILQLGAEPVAAAWPVFSRETTRYVLAGARWHDADSSAVVLLGDEATTARAIAGELATAARTSASLRRRVEHEAASLAWGDDWKALDVRGREALDRAIREISANEVAVLRDAVAALPVGAAIQLGNSLPIRTIDHVPATGEAVVLTQRGAAGIDGLIASAAGATQAGRPVLLVLGDVSFAHDLGGLLAARAAVAPLAILVIDNAGGRIFDGLPVAKAGLGEAFAKHWTTPPDVDVVAVARALGLAAMPASPETIGYDVTTALAAGVTVIHAPVSPTGAREVRARAIELATTRAPKPVVARSSAPVIAPGERL